MALAPEIFERSHALRYIYKVEKFLLGEHSLGVSTLSENHSIYSSYYDNGDMSNCPNTSHGYSYHNGPEWVWLYGFYILAKIEFNEEHPTKSMMLALLQPHAKHIYSDEWCSLPEITNKDGERNQFSCNAQAWSISSILMALNAIQKIK